MLHSYDALTYIIQDLVMPRVWRGTTCLSQRIQTLPPVQWVWERDYPLPVKCR